MGRGARLAAAVREVVRRRAAQRRGELRRPARRRRQRRPGRAPLGRRAARTTPATSPTPSCSARSRMAANALEPARRAGRRPRLHLPADGPRGGHRDAGLRAHRRRALGRVRRLLARRRWSTASPTPRPRSSSPPTAATAAATASALKPAVDEALQRCPSVTDVARRQAHQAGRRLGRGPRPLVERRRRQPARGPRGAGVRQPSSRCSCSTPPARPASPRASCTPPAAT